MPRMLPVFTAFLALAPSLASAQETIASDRPGVGSGSFVLERGTVQAEAGIGVASGGGADEYSVGQLLVRFGLGGVELQALPGSIVAVRGPESDDTGIGDLGIGAKARLLHRPEDGLALSALATLSLPTGSDFLTNDEAVPALSLLLDRTLGERAALSGNLGYSFGPGAVEDFLWVTVTPGFSFPGEAGAGAYFGYAGFFADSGNQHFVEGGWTLVPNPDLQLDVNGGVEVDTGDWFVGLGIAVRRTGG